MRRTRTSPGNLVHTVLGVALVLLAWWIASRIVAATIVLPGPLPALLALWSEIASAGFYGHLAATLARALVGFASAFAIGIAWGLAAGSSGTLGSALRPALVLIRATPVIAVILLAIVWFRPSAAPVFVTLLMVVPVVVENVAAGARAASGELREMARHFRVPRARVRRELTLPALRPYLDAAAHSGLGMAFKVTVAAEVLVQPGRAIGAEMQEARFYLDTPRILALTLCVIALSAVAEGALRLAERAFDGRVRLRKRGARDRTEASRGRNGDRVDGIRVDRVHKSFDGSRVLAGLSIDAPSGLVTVVLGPSGCGKTTLLRLIAGLDTPDAGRVGRPERCGICFQEPRLLPWADAGANVAFVMDAAGPTDVARALEAAGLSVAIGAMPATLSGGMQQRLSLARALAYDGSAILLDEPFQNLDLAVKLALSSRLRSVTRERSLATVMVTHDVVEALAAGDRIVILSGTPAAVVAERQVTLSEQARDPRSAEALAVAAALYSDLLPAGP